MSGRLKGRVAIITGAGRGIGRASAILFAREGASVIVATRSATPGQAVVNEICAEGGSAVLDTVDVSTRIAVTGLVTRTAERFGRIDIVLHNAATIGAASMEKLQDELLERILAVNLKAAFWFAAEALPYLEKSGAGRLLLTSSITGNRHVLAGYAAYGASKAGLNGFIRLAGHELARRGITVNGVEPGVTLTEGSRAAMPEGQRLAFAATIPRGRFASPDDVAQALLFLATPESSHITGQTIVVDGGQSLGTA
jgi:3-oxoacyl-[acyl-carrier protein] reductase